MAKKVLNTKRNTVAVMPKPTLSFGAPDSVTVPVETVPPRTAMDAIMPKAPKSMRLRRPERSMRGSATSEARKYSVPLQAASRRDMDGSKPSEFSNRNVA